MDKVIFILFGIFYIIYGLIVISGKKFMVRSKYEAIIQNFFFLAIIISRFIEIDGGIFIISIFILIFALIFLGQRGVYTMYNVNGETFSSILMSILEEKNISYVVNKDELVLKGYNNEVIFYRKPLNSLQINLKEIRHLDFYKELLKELSNQIKEVNLKLFPTAGIVDLLLGIGFLALVQFM
ncbi:hypothetical protein GOQ27_14410 [Clostridium sp. D2Q-11]|uniref:Uncharacterized protein n=1 Tax=Anaeromonas frigoriresistens TaxID=2683708 RepID=A0A942Z9T8_9FIRM|nr:hypothetical protein [Anaeromonas frigoriresistens]MBS4539663.1 hypothetical protein [Anaeromonas frigoriresistens]